MDWIGVDKLFDHYLNKEEEVVLVMIVVNMMSKSAPRRETLSNHYFVHLIHSTLLQDFELNLLKLRIQDYLYSPAMLHWVDCYSQIKMRISYQ